MSNEEDVDMKDEMEPPPPAENGEARGFIGPLMPAAPVQQERRRPVREFGADAPARKRLDDEWTLTEINQWASTIEDLLPPRAREGSTKAIILDTSESSLGISRALIAHGMESIAQSITPDAPGTWFVSGLDPDSWARLDTVVGLLRPKHGEETAKVVPPPSWSNYEDLSIFIVPKWKILPEDVATGYPKVGFPRPTRIHRVYGPNREKDARRSKQSSTPLQTVVKFSATHHPFAHFRKVLQGIKELLTQVRRASWPAFAGACASKFDTQTLQKLQDDASLVHEQVSGGEAESISPTSQSALEEDKQGFSTLDAQSIPATKLNDKFMLAEVSQSVFTGPVSPSLPQNRNGTHNTAVLIRSSEFNSRRSVKTTEQEPTSFTNTWV
jgi:hypothetical protein